jgi:hypothetical protein
VKLLFDQYGKLKCPTTGRILFDNVSMEKANSILRAIADGHVSDPPGMSFYFLIGKDKNHLPIIPVQQGNKFLGRCSPKHHQKICFFRREAASC